MIRPTTEVKLPMSGYTAHIATFMTFADRQEMAKAIIKGKSITQETANEMIKGNMSVSGEDAVDSQIIMLKRMTIRLVAPDGTEEDPADVVNLPDDDVDLINAELAKIQTPKKKLD